ncbi:M20/M25/M40 family metallo-hydrolase [Rhodococcus sp. JVH1]
MHHLRRTPHRAGRIVENGRSRATRDPRLDQSRGSAVRIQHHPGARAEPVQRAERKPLVQTILPIVERVTGKPPVIRGEPYWTDAALLLDAGIPGLLFGVDGGGAHAATEWIEIDSLARVTQILTDTAASFCK